MARAKTKSEVLLKLIEMLKVEINLTLTGVLRDGNVVNIEDNFYHKSQTSLNHYWTISDKSNLSTALYASWGTGGGGGTAGRL